jgi:hypothetical protein
MKARMESKMSSPVVDGVDIEMRCFTSSDSPPTGRLPSA